MEMSRFRRIMVIQGILKNSCPELVSTDVQRLWIRDGRLMSSHGNATVTIDEATLGDILEDMELRLLRAKAQKRFEDRLNSSGLEHKFLEQSVKVEGMYFDYKDGLDDLEAFVSEIAEASIELGGTDNAFVRFRETAPAAK